MLGAEGRRCPCVVATAVVAAGLAARPASSYRRFRQKRLCGTTAYVVRSRGPAPGLDRRRRCPPPPLPPTGSADQTQPLDGAPSGGGPRGRTRWNLYRRLPAEAAVLRVGHLAHDNGANPSLPDPISGRRHRRAARKRRLGASRLGNGTCGREESRRDRFAPTHPCMRPGLRLVVSGCSHRALRGSMSSPGAPRGDEGG
jgi:hypothetical protein